MLDINFIRENVDLVKKGVGDKQFDTAIVDRVLELDEKRRKLILEVEGLRAKRNKIASEGKPSDAKAMEGRQIKEELKDKEPEYEKIEAEYKETLFKIPNLPSKKSPIGKGEKDNKEIRKWGNQTKFDLNATAEVTLAGSHADEVIPEAKLPLKYIGYSHCFRKEAGAYGKYSKGMYRVHQFTKAEMFIYCKPEDSDKFHELLLKMEEEIYQELGIPHRVLEMCTGDLGAMASRKFDIEAWMPGREDYGEVTSTSNCTDYQARNLNIKFRRNTGEAEYIHMLNGTAIVMSRVPLAILENFQQKDGSVLIPKVLQKWMGKEKISAA